MKFPSTLGWGLCSKGAGVVDDLIYQSLLSSSLSGASQAPTRSLPAPGWEITWQGDKGSFQEPKILSAVKEILSNK